MLLIIREGYIGAGLAIHSNVNSFCFYPGFERNRSCDVINFKIKYQSESPKLLNIFIKSMFITRIVSEVSNI